MNVEIESFDMECGCEVDTASDTREMHSGLQKPLNENLIKHESERQKQTCYTSSSHVVRAFEVLDSFRKDKVLCDIVLETDDGTLVYGHKAVLASATPYFQVMFTSFEESKKSRVILRELDSDTLIHLVDFIYTGRIIVTEEEVQTLLHAANLLQIQDVKEACCDFLQTQLSPKNCLGLKGLISLYDCKEYLSTFKSYILQNFSEIVEYGEYLDLSYDELVELIYSNELNISPEEKVFECVVDWVNHDITTRKIFFPKLMKHVRLPLASKEYLYNRVREEPLIKNSLECRDFLDEAFYFQLLNSEKPDIIRTKPRVPKVILIIGKEQGRETLSIRWFRPSTNRLQHFPYIISIPELDGQFIVLNDKLLFFLRHAKKNVYMLNLFSPSPRFRNTVPMLQQRDHPGVGVLDNCIYVVGGAGDDLILRSAEVFDSSTHKWNTISDMSEPRDSCGVGVLNNHLYAVGGMNAIGSMKSVEHYCPRTNTWAPVADMNERRSNVKVAVLNGVMYAVGGTRPEYLKTVEAYNPSSNTWTFVCDMHKERSNPLVVVLYGLLYVMGYEDGRHSAETYDPKSNIWTMLPGTINIYDTFSGAVAINKPPFAYV